MKRYFIFILITLLALSGCQKTANTKNTDMSYAPYLIEGVIDLNGELIMVQNNIIYSFDSTNQSLSPYCNLTNCSHVFHPEEKNTCAAAISGGAIIGTSNGKLYTATAPSERLTMVIEEVLPDTPMSERNMIATILDYYDLPRAIFSNGYCYFSTNKTTLPNFNSVALKRVSLTAPEAEVETLCEIAGGDFFTYAPFLHAYDQYLIMTTRYGYKATLCVYDNNQKEMILESESYEYAGYHSGQLVYINESNECIEFMDLETMEITQQISIDNYIRGITLACDQDYIYINWSTNSLADEHVTDDYILSIYSYAGELIDSIELCDVESIVSAVYMCSNKDYIFVGVPSLPCTRGLYLLEKEKIGSYQAPITLYELSEN